MVIKQITPHRKNIFTQNLKVILQAMYELEKIGVSNKEISEFLYSWLHKKTIFKGKLTYDFTTGKFTHVSNYPVHLEYYEQLLRKSENRSVENIDEIKPVADEKIEELKDDQIENKNADENLKKEKVSIKKKKKKRKKLVQK